MFLHNFYVFFYYCVLICSKESRSLCFFFEAGPMYVFLEDEPIYVFFSIPVFQKCLYVFFLFLCSNFQRRPDLTKVLHSCVSVPRKPNNLEWSGGLICAVSMLSIYLLKKLA